tara:strand:+ start:215 stop:817 length:603 start_codon:yes stop_codon:yes gene_type:complete
VLTAVNQINRPKFLVDDLALYSGIIGDLFLNVEEPVQDNSLLVRAIEEVGLAQNVHNHPAFLNKILELREMILVRHGLMIVGDPLSGKTCCYTMLQEALSLLNARKELPCDLNPKHELKTDVFVINPKSISMGDLYGYVDACWCVCVCVSVPFPYLFVYRSNYEHCRLPFGFRLWPSLFDFYKFWLDRWNIGILLEYWNV